MKSSLFQKHLEQWIDEIVSRDGMAKDETIKTIKERFERAMQTNIDHYRYMMENVKENGDLRMADRYRLMAEIYQTSLPGNRRT